ncbi:MAG: hypothetical protein ACOYLD_13700, partial [Anaerohalosphaeraceae bacterium]
TSMSPSARVFADQRPIPFTCQTITETHTTVKQQLTIYSASPKVAPAALPNRQMLNANRQTRPCGGAADTYNQVFAGK